jgi:hypothetical protein
MTMATSTRAREAHIGELGKLSAGRMHAQILADLACEDWAGIACEDQCIAHLDQPIDRRGRVKL